MAILKHISRLDFLKLMPARKSKIDASPANKLPPISSYKANTLAAALHPEFQNLIVSETVSLGEGVKTFVFAPDKEGGTSSLAYFSAGQYIAVSQEIGEARLSRPYSLSSAPKEALAGKYSLTIKRVEGGLLSQYALDNWTVGTRVTASAPLGTFTYEPLRDAKTVIGIAGGSGITPFYSLAQAIADGDEDANLTLIYGSRTKKDILFLKEFEEIAARTDKFKLINVLSEEAADGAEKGFITADIIKKYAPDGEYSVFVCGPQAMYTFVDKEIEKLGLRRKFIRHELFGEYHNPSKENDYPLAAVGQKFKLSVTVCGVTRVIDCDADVTLLNAMEQNGIQAPADCRSGVCGWCHSRLISGNVYVPKSVDGRRLADYKYGYIHPCCTFPIGDVAIDVPPMPKE